MAESVDLLSNPAYGIAREVRPSQIRMAEAIEHAIEKGGVCFIEAPVGTGKSLAYLTPALLAPQRRVVVATAKKGLQDQIQNKDLPFLVEKLKQNLGAVFDARMKDPESGAPYRPGVVIKGKSNYVCRAHAKKYSPSDDLLQWIASTKTGEWGDYPGKLPVWRNYATAENCEGRSCDQYAKCAYATAKDLARISKTVVVNHHLLGSDMFFGLGKLVGGTYDILIVDEAHKLSDGIRAAFTVKVNESAAQEMVDDLKGLPWVFPKANALIGPWSYLFENVSQVLTDEKGFRIDPRMPHLRDAPVFDSGDHDALEGLKELRLQLGETLKSYTNPEDGSIDGNVPEDIRHQVMKAQMVKRRADGLSRGIMTMQGKAVPVEGEDPEEAFMRSQRILGNTAIIGSQDKKGILLQAMPITLGGLVKPYFSQIKTVILTSATLALEKHFDHVSNTIGVKPSLSMILPPVFDYAAQGFAFIPKDLPNVPRNDEAKPAVDRKRLDYAARLVKLSRGGAFILATAYDDLNEQAFYLARNTPHRVFAQLNEKIKTQWYREGYEQSMDANPWFGEPTAILQRFLKTPDAVLVGAKSFWEGVDVVGEQLRLVILTKLPFPNISDPLVKARRRPIISWQLESGVSRKEAEQFAWSKVDLADMLIDTRQGVGRLIRSLQDRGVIAILDSRVWSKPYGGAVKAALEFGVTDQFAKCEKWLPRFVDMLKAAK